MYWLSELKYNCIVVRYYIKSVSSVYLHVTAFQNTTLFLTLYLSRIFSPIVTFSNKPRKPSPFNCWVKPCSPNLKIHALLSLRRQLQKLTYWSLVLRSTVLQRMRERAPAELSKASLAHPLLICQQSLLVAAGNKSRITNHRVMWAVKFNLCSPVWHFR